jgi:glycerol-3-phosphate acyltransferase PlsY
VVKESDPALAKKLGIATVLLDALKGVAVLIAGSIAGVAEETMWAIAVLSVIGHCFSPYLMFEGGKGVATGVGVMLYMLPIPTIVALVAWAILAKTVRISSVSSLGALIVLIIASYILYPDMAHAPIWIIAFIIFYKHWDNIVRLIKGEEKRTI